MNVYFYEGDGTGFMDCTGATAVGAIGRNERGEGYSTRIREEKCNLAESIRIKHKKYPNQADNVDFSQGKQRRSCERTFGRDLLTYFSYASNVLITIFLRKSQILVQPKTDVIPIKAISRKTEMEEMLLKRGGNCGFAACREPGKPDREAILPPKLPSLYVSEGRMPCDVA